MEIFKTDKCDIEFIDIENGILIIKENSNSENLYIIDKYNKKISVYDEKLFL